MATKQATPEQAELLVDKWEQLASRAKPSAPIMPIAVLTGEALDLAALLAEYWDAPRGTKRPALRDAVAVGALDETAAADLRELVTAVSYAHAQFRSHAASPEAPVARAKALLAELRQSLTFLEGVAPPRAERRARRSHDALALELDGLAARAHKLRKRLAALPGFDPACLDEARSVAARLREQSALRTMSEAAMRRKDLRQTRDRLVALLNERMKRARRAVRFVFRAHPKIAGRAGSAYERERKAQQRRGLQKRPS